MIAVILVLLAAFGLDQMIGDPRYRLHPVRMMGAWIHRLDSALRAADKSSYVGGFLLYVAACGAPMLLVYLVFSLLDETSWLGIFWAIFCVYSCLGLRDLICHVEPIELALNRGDLPAARRGVGMIVGRETDQLDAAAVVRGTVESVAENFVDAFLAPVCCFTVAACAGLIWGNPVEWGVLAVVWHRVTNTLDAMVGYKNARYAQLGYVSAKMDDCLNFIPARLSIPVIVLSAQFRGLAAGAGWKIAWRDRLKHPSPNSAHAESAVAGCLGVRLGGPTQYRHGLVEKAWLGKEGREAQVTDLGSCRQLIQLAAWMTVLLSCFVVICWGGLS